MKTIQVLGTGCPACSKLAEVARAAVCEAGLDIEVVKIEDITEILEFGAIAMPALAVDGEVKVAGRIPTREEILSFVSDGGQHDA